MKCEGEDPINENKINKTFQQNQNYISMTCPRPQKKKE